MYVAHVAKDLMISNDGGRLEYDIHPYGKMGAEVTCAVIDNIQKILLGRKNDTNFLILVGDM